MKKITNKYGKLLVKYCKDDDLIELINQCIIHDLEEREQKFEISNKYPEQRDRLMKLKSDLDNMRDYLIKKVEGENE